MNQQTDPQSFIPLSNLAFHVLVALADEDRHGYAIIKDIEQRTDSGMSVRSGALYTVLQRLLEDGLIANAAVPKPRRRDRQTAQILPDHAGRTRRCFVGRFAFSVDGSSGGAAPIDSEA